MIDNSTRIKRMSQLLTDALQPSQLDIVDESHLHAGHAGAKSGKGHFAVTIVSTKFEGKRLLPRHRMVYEALGEMMQTDIHALSIKSLTPDEQ